MKTIALGDAKARLSAIVRDAEAGEETVITRRGAPVARVVPIQRGRGRQFGFDDGLGTIAADFDAPLPADVLSAFSK